MIVSSMVTAAIIGAAATTATAAIAAKTQSSSAKRAAEAEMSALDKQLAWEKEQEATRKAEWERSQAEAKAQWEAEQATETERYGSDLEMRRAEFELAKRKYVDRQAQMAPYRQVGVGALAQLAGMAGLTPQAAAPAPAPLLETMPDDWQPGDPVTANTPKATDGASTPAEAPSFLENPQILPESLPARMTTVAPTAASTTPTMTTAAYQALAAPRSEGTEALTPAQVAALVRAGRGGSSLGSLARSRRAAV